MKSRGIMKCAIMLTHLAIMVQLAFGLEPPGLIPRPLFPDDPKGLKLPGALPRMVDTNGNVVWIDEQFTTKAYERAAFKQLLQEANRVARELQLPEPLAIAETNLVEAFVGPFGYNYIHKRVGVVSTKHYCYYVCQGNKFNELDVANYDETCLKLRKLGAFPITQMNTKSAYQLATQWLVAASMDVKRLNQDCSAHIAVSPFWNGLAHLGEKPKKQFVPIYFVWWTSAENDLEQHGSVAYVEFYSPTETLLQLSVSNPKYILRKPLVFTNLDSLLPGTAPVIKLPPPQMGGQPTPG